MHMAICTRIFLTFVYVTDTLQCKLSKLMPIMSSINCSHVNSPFLGEEEILRQYRV
jgi:hypothetical protein